VVIAGDHCGRASARDNGLGSIGTAE